MAGYVDWGGCRKGVRRKKKRSEAE